MAALLVSMVSYYAADVVAAVTCLALLWLHHNADGPMLALVSVFVLVEVAIPAAVCGRRAVPITTTLHLPVWVEHLPGVGDLVDTVAAAPNDLIRDPLLVAGTFACHFGIILLEFTHSVARPARRSVRRSSRGWRLPASPLVRSWR